VLARRAARGAGAGTLAFRRHLTQFPTARASGRKPSITADQSTPASLPSPPSDPPHAGSARDPSADRKGASEMNRVLLAGRLTRDPEMRALASGKHVTQFTVATTEYAGNGKERGEFHNVVTWDRLAEVCGR